MTGSTARVFVDAWRLSLGTLTAVPVPPPEVVDRRRAGLAMLVAPIAVVPLGAGLGAVVVVADRLMFSPLVTALLGIAVVVVGNRCFHLDGLSDVADGFAASYDRERSLAVMKSGTSGPAGVVATVLVLGLQVAGLASMVGSLEGWRAGVLAGVALCASRMTLAICCVRGVPAAREGGLGSSYTQTVGRTAAAVALLSVGVIVSLVGVCAGLACWRGAAAVLLAVAVTVVLVARAWRRFGGVTGDVFGAGIEIAFAAMLVVLS